MSCFIVPMTQAVATTIYRKLNTKKINTPETSPLLRHVPTLEKMLWGGTVMLVVDHIINGEFFAWNPMELLTVGLPMSLAVTAIWAIWSYAHERKTAQI